MPFIIVLVIVVLIAAAWKVIVAASALAAVFYACRWAGREHRKAAAAEQALRDAIIARCDQQHAWIMDGDDRGIYGA